MRADMEFHVLKRREIRIKNPKMQEFARILISKKNLLDNLYKRKEEASELIEKGKSSLEIEKDLDAIIYSIFSLEFEINDMLIESYVKEIEYLEEESKNLLSRINMLKNTYTNFEKNSFIDNDNILELRLQEIKLKYYIK
jgi:hypothetical protein